MKKEEKKILKKEFKLSITELKQKVSALQKAVKELRQNGLNERILVFAIQQISNKYYAGYPKIGMAEAKAFLRGIETIEDYLFPKEA